MAKLGMKSYGGGKDDVLIGGKGNDFLQGTAGQSVLAADERLTTINPIALRADNTRAKCLKGFKNRRKSGLHCGSRKYKPNQQFSGMEPEQSATEFIVINSHHQPAN